MLFTHIMSFTRSRKCSFGNFYCSWFRLSGYMDRLLFDWWSLIVFCNLNGGLQTKVNALHYELLVKVAPLSLTISVCVVVANKLNPWFMWRCVPVRQPPAAGVITALPKVNPPVICFTTAPSPTKHRALYQVNQLLSDMNPRAERSHTSTSSIISETSLSFSKKAPCPRFPARLCCYLSAAKRLIYLQCAILCGI